MPVVCCDGVQTDAAPRVSAAAPRVSAGGMGGGLAGALATGVLEYGMIPAISSREAGWRPYWPLEREPGMIPEVGCVRLAAGSLMWPNFEFGSMMFVVTVSPIDLGWMGMVLEVSFDMMVAR